MPSNPTKGFSKVVSPPSSSLMMLADVLSLGKSSNNQSKLHMPSDGSSRSTFFSNHMDSDDEKEAFVPKQDRVSDTSIEAESRIMSMSGAAESDKLPNKNFSCEYHNPEQIPKKGVIKRKHLERNRIRSKLLRKIPPIDMKSLQSDMDQSTPLFKMPRKKATNHEPEISHSSSSTESALVHSNHENTGVQLKLENISAKMAHKEAVNHAPEISHSSSAMKTPMTQDNHENIQESVKTTDTVFQGKYCDKKRALFPEKLHELLSRDDTDPGVIGWAPDGKSFVIRDSKKFSEDLMSQVFNHTSFASFQRQLNLYSFKRIFKMRSRTDRGYYHELFLREAPKQCLKMKRNKVKANKEKSHDASEREKDDCKMGYCSESDNEKKIKTECNSMDKNTQNGNMSHDNIKILQNLDMSKVIGNTLEVPTNKKSVESPTVKKEKHATALSKQQVNETNLSTPIIGGLYQKHPRASILDEPTAAHGYTNQDLMMIRQERELIEKELAKKITELQALMQQPQQYSYPMSSNEQIAALMTPREIQSHGLSALSHAMPDLRDREAYIQQLLNTDAAVPFQAPLNEHMLDPRHLGEVLIPHNNLSHVFSNQFPQHDTAMRDMIMAYIKK